MSEWISNQPESIQIILLLVSGGLFSLAVNIYRKNVILFLLCLVASYFTGNLYITASSILDTFGSMALIVYGLILTLVGIAWGEHIKKSKQTKEQRKKEIQNTIKNAQSIINNATKELNEIEPTPQNINEDKG
jgi:uncharacterized membrane protein